MIYLFGGRLLSTEGASWSLTNRGVTFSGPRTQSVQGLDWTNLFVACAFFSTKNDFCSHLYNYIFPKIEFVSFLLCSACAKCHSLCHGHGTAPTEHVLLGAARAGIPMLSRAHAMSTRESSTIFTWPQTGGHSFHICRDAREEPRQFQIEGHVSVAR